MPLGQDAVLPSHQCLSNTGARVSSPVKRVRQARKEAVEWAKGEVGAEIEKLWKRVVEVKTLAL